MTTMLLAFAIMALVIVIMAIGVIFSNKPIKGSCGGMSALGMEVACDICGGDKQRCEKENKSTEISQQNDLSYDASKQ